MRTVQWLAFAAIVGGVLILGGYWIYLVLKGIFGSDEVPVLIQVAIPAIGLGCVALIVVAVIQRLGEKEKNHIKEIEH